MNSPEETVVILVLWVNDCLCFSNLLWERDLPTTSLHGVHTINVELELKDVVEDVLCLL